MKKLILVSAISIIFAATSIAQNVGIGTTSPTTKLHVAGAIASTPNTDVAAATVSIPNNTTIFRLSATAGVQANALSMSGTPTEGQLLTIYNQDGDPATFAGYTIPATSGVVTVEYINTGWRLVSSENGNPAWSTTGNSGTTASNFVGTTDNNGLTFKTNNAIIGFLPSSAASTGNTYFGVGNGTPGGIYNVAFGFHTQNSSNTGSGNVSIGWNVLDINTTGSSNVGIGWQSLAFNATGGGNTAVGTQSMMLNSGGGANTAFGKSTLENNVSGNNNVAVGSSAGKAALGSGNVFLGNSAGSAEIGSNKLYIANTNTATPLLYGDFTNNHLTVNDSLTSKYLQMTNGANANYLLQSDATGNGIWVNPNTIAANNIYNTDGTLSANRTVTMSGNNLNFTGGNVGIGNLSPTQALDVTGVINASTGFKVAGGTPSTSTYLKGDGTNFVAGTIQAADLPSLSGSYVDLTTAQTAAGVKTWSANAVFNGFVGVGTSSPNNPLTVGLPLTTSFSPEASVTTNGSRPLFVAQTPANKGVMIGYGGNDIQGRSGSNFATNGVLLINPYGGNVGVGLASPGQALDVAGVINASTGFKVNGGTPSTSTYLKGDGTNFVAGSILAADLPSLSSTYVDLTTAQTAAGVKTWSSNAIFNGNMGIGTTTPTNKLEVVGNTKTTNFQMTTGATANYLLQSDASGNGTWMNPTTIGVTSITSASPLTSNVAATGAVTVNLTGIVPVANGGTNLSSYAIGDVLYASAATTIAKLADVAAGSYLRSGGVGTAPVWSTLVLPNAATTGDLHYASASNTISNLADVAVGSVLTSGGVGVAPSWSTGTGLFIQNQTTQQASSNYNISGAGVVGTTLTVGAGIATSPNTISVNNAGTTAASVGTYPLAISRANTVDMTLGSDASNSYIQSWNSKPLVINNQGNNVGIGITPTQKLDVNGNIRANATYYTQAAFGQILQVGDDAYINDVNTANTMGIIGQQNATYGGLALGTGGAYLYSNGNANVGIGTVTPTNKLTVSATAGSSGLTLTGLTSPLANTTLPMGLNSSGTVVDGSRKYYTTGNVTGGWNGNTGKQIGSFTASGRPYLVVVSASQWGNSGAVHNPILSYGGGSGGTAICSIAPFYYNESNSHKTHSTSTVYTFPANTTINLYIWTGDSSDSGDYACVTVVEL